MNFINILLIHKHYLNLSLIFINKVSLFCVRPSHSKILIIKIDNRRNEKAVLERSKTALNLGVGVIAEWVAREEIKNQSLIMYPIQPAPIRHWGYYISRNKQLNLTEVRFIDLFSSQLVKVINGV